VERWIKDSAGADNRERVRAVAIEHVQQAMDALEFARGLAAERDSGI
jgi:hypothetical protein